MGKTNKGAELGGESHFLELLVYLFLPMSLILRLTILSEVRLWIYHKHQIRQVTRINDEPTETSSAPA